MTPTLSRIMHQDRANLGRVCRNLFGPVDHEQLSRDLKAKLGEIAEQDARRWNFNFETNTPLTGRYQWEEVSCHSSPALYQDSVCHENVDDSMTKDLVLPEEALHGVVQTNQENCSKLSNALKCPNEATPVPRKRRASSERTARPQNTRITDFFVKRRRHSEMKTNLNSLFTSSTEQNLRKRIR